MVLLLMVLNIHLDYMIERNYLVDQLLELELNLFLKLKEINFILQKLF